MADLGLDSFVKELLHVNRPLVYRFGAHLVRLYGEPVVAAEAVRAVVLRIFLKLRMVTLNTHGYPSDEVLVLVAVETVCLVVHVDDDGLVLHADSPYDLFDIEVRRAVVDQDAVVAIVSDDPGVLVRSRVVLWVAVPSAVRHRTEVLVDKFTVCWDAVLAEPASTVAETVTVAQAFYKAVAVVDRVASRHGAPLAVDVGHTRHLNVLEFEIAVACPVRIVVALRELDVQSGEVYFESDVVDPLHVPFRNAGQALLGKEAEAAENVIRFESAGDDVHLVLYLGFHTIYLAKRKATRRKANNDEKKKSTE